MFNCVNLLFTAKWILLLITKESFSKISKRLQQTFRQFCVNKLQHHSEQSSNDSNY